MAHAQKPDFVFRRNGQVHLNRQGTSVQSTTGSRVVRISGSNAGYTMFRGSVKGIGYHYIRQFPLHFPSRVSPCAITFQLDSIDVTVCHHIPTGLYWRQSVLLHFNWTLLTSPCAITFQLDPIDDTACHHISTGRYWRHRVPSHFNWTLLMSPCAITFQLDSIDDTVCHHISTGLYWKTYST
jgi:hypothetical protein